MLSRKFYWIILTLGLVIISIQVSTVLGQEAPIHIVKSKSTISPNPASVNQSIQLKICVHNLNESEISCSFKTLVGENISIYPAGEFNVTVLGKGHGYDYSLYANTYFYFTLMPNKTGSYPIIVELWYIDRQVDFFSETLQVQEEVPRDEYQFSSYEFRLAFVYFIALLTIGLVYLKVFNEEGKLTGEDFDLSLVFYILGITALVWISYSLGGFSIVLSPSIGRIELILAITFILCFASLVLMKGRLDASFRLTNVIVFLLIIPLVLDWLYVPNIPSPDTLVGKIIWQLFEIAIATIIGAIISIVFKQKPDKIL